LTPEALPAKALDSAMARFTHRASPDTALVSASFPSVPASPGRARALLRDALDGRVDPNVLATVLLLASELINNASAVAGAVVDLRVLCSDAGVIRVEVADSVPAFPHMVDRGPDAEDGRGLLLVDALADAWGAVPAAGGKVTWFALQT
jgi:hypothetical protein